MKFLFGFISFFLYSCNISTEKGQNGILISEVRCITDTGYLQKLFQLTESKQTDLDSHDLESPVFSGRYFSFTITNNRKDSVFLLGKLENTFLIDSLLTRSIEIDKISVDGKVFENARLDNFSIEEYFDGFNQLIKPLESKTFLAKLNVSKLSKLWDIRLVYGTISKDSIVVHSIKKIINSSGCDKMY